MKKIHLLLCIFLVLSLFVMGCGGGGGKSDTATPAPSPAATVPDENTVTGKLQASIINGVKVCVADKGISTGNCSVTIKEGDFILHSAAGKQLVVLLAGANIGSVDGAAVVDGLTITPALMASGNTVKEKKIKAIFHQSVKASSGIGENGVYDLGVLKSSDIKADDIKAYLDGKKGSISVAGNFLNYTIEKAAVEDTTPPVNGPACLLPSLSFTCVPDQYNVTCTVSWSRSSEGEPYSVDASPQPIVVSVLKKTPFHVTNLAGMVYFMDNATASIGLQYRSSLVFPDGTPQTFDFYFGAGGDVIIRAQILEMVGADCVIPPTVEVSLTLE